ncbi:glutathione S-transferase family protein [Sphingobium ummariense]
MITENALISQFVCDTAGWRDLIPPQGTTERYKVLEWRSWLASELVKAFTPLFMGLGEDKKIGLARGRSRFCRWWIGRSARSFLAGERFTEANAYLCVVSSWSLFFGLDLKRHAGAASLSSPRRTQAVSA